MKAAVLTLMLLAVSAAADPVAMTAANWSTKGEAEFANYKGFDAVVLKTTSAQAVANTIALTNGSIEFDVETQGVMGVGAAFRRQDGNNYEDFYFRPKPNCDTAGDCLQYAPMERGVLLWDFFPQYQTAAPLKDGAWNHVKLAISGERLSIFVNGSAVLKNVRLEGGMTGGGLMLHGPGAFANLSVTPDARAVPAKKAVREDAHFVRAWQVSQPSVLAAGAEPSIAAMPTAEWKPLTAERGGLVNLTRLYGKPVGQPERALAWLKTSITARKAATKTVSIGLCREVWLFVNGEKVFADKNPYQPKETRKAPDGRCTPENASFQLPLKKGRNDIAVAVANAFYGWGIVMRLDDLEGVKLAKP